MAITLTLKTTTVQETKLALVLQVVNKQRVRNGLDVFATVEDWLVDEVTKAAKAYFAQLDETDMNSIRLAWADATDEQKKQIKAILGWS